MASDRETQDQKGLAAAPKKIFAVATGHRAGNLRINSTGDLRDLRRVRVRPYLRGLVQGLDAFGYQLGKDYTIVFRQREATALASAFNNVNAGDVVFCMSSRVVRAAQANVGATIPIVGIVSDPGPAPGGEGFDTITNICGVSAKRTASAGDCFERLVRTVPGLTEVFVLHQAGYGPSSRALALVQAAGAAKMPAVTITPVSVTTAAALEQTLENDLPERDPANAPTAGVQVLPVDICLSQAQEIIDLAQGEKKLPTFFPVPDWVRSNESSALGAYGVPQRRCGALMAERVDKVWKNGGTVPGGTFARWTEAPVDAFEFVASTAAAQDLNIKLDPGIPQV